MDTIQTDFRNSQNIKSVKMNIYYIYYAVDKKDVPKVGCSKYIKRRIRNTQYKTIKLLEAHFDKKTASDREIELQLKYFGKRDSNKTYLQMLNSNQLKGEKVKTSKITKKDVDFIREKYFYIVNQSVKVPEGMFTSGQLADMFNISRVQVRNIIKGKYWK